MKNYEKHEFNILPNCKKLDYLRLRASIKTNGYDSKFPIVLYDGKILDGWQRYQVCKEGNIDFTTKEFDGDEEAAILFVRKSNIRRDLTEDQKAAFLVDNNSLLDRYKAQARERQKATQLKKGNNIPGASSIKGTQKGEAIDQAAKDFGTTGGRVRRSKKLKDSDPEAFEKVKTGEKTLRQAENELPESKKIIKKDSPVKHNDKIAQLSRDINKVADNLQFLLQGDLKPKTTIDWGKISSIQHSLYDIVRLAASLGVDVEKIVETFNGKKKVNIPKHLQKPENLEVVDIEYVEIKN